VRSWEPCKSPGGKPRPPTARVSRQGRRDSETNTMPVTSCPKSPGGTTTSHSVARASRSSGPGFWLHTRPGGQGRSRHGRPRRPGPAGGRCQSWSSAFHRARQPTKHISHPGPVL
jgi:hypothetical protein